MATFYYISLLEIILLGKKVPLWLSFKCVEKRTGDKFESLHERRSSASGSTSSPPSEAKKKGTEFTVLFKSGDDLRQDQLTLQVIKIMDQLWREKVQHLLIYYELTNEC